jgi:hypothetical protein
VTLKRLPKPGELILWGRDEIEFVLQFNPRTYKLVVLTTDCRIYMSYYGFDTQFCILNKPDE